MARWWDEGKTKIFYGLWFSDDHFLFFCKTVSCLADVYSTALHVWTRESPRGVLHPICLEASTFQMVWRFLSTYLMMTICNFFSHLLFELCWLWGYIKFIILFFTVTFVDYLLNMVFLVCACFWFENSVICSEFEFNATAINLFPADIPTNVRIWISSVYLYVFFG